MKTFYVENTYDPEDEINGKYESASEAEVVKKIFPNALEIDDLGTETMCGQHVHGFDVLGADGMRTQLLVSPEKFDWENKCQEKAFVEPLQFLTI